MTAMVAADRTEVDLFLVCDTTASMGRYISSLAATIRQVFAVIKLLFRGRVKLHVVSYKDYCDGKLVVTHCSQRTHTNKQILKFVADLVPHGGGDIPEAIKTALNFVHTTVSRIRQSSTTPTEALVLIFTDAPPHHAQTLSRFWRHERDAIETKKEYTAGYDWLSIRRAFLASKIPVHTFHSNLDCAHQTAQSVLFYSALGSVILVENDSTTEITKATMGLLVQLMGHKFEFSNWFTCVQVWTDSAAFDAGTEDDVFPHMDTRLACTRRPFHFDAIRWMHEDLIPLPALFDSNDEYQHMVYNVFAAFFTPANVLALTYNPILAKLWRVVCKRRLDPRLAALSTKLSMCVPALDGQDKHQIQQWIQESHNEGHVIRDTILSNDNVSGDHRCVVLERSALVDAIDAADVRSLARAPNPGVIRTVQTILTHLQCLDGPEDGLVDADGVPHHLPLALPDAKLFSYLCHLVVPGTTFSVRGSAVVAMMCVSSNHSILKDRAHDFLDRIRGTWLPLDLATDFPEILSVEYIKLLHRNRQFLTANEITVYDRLYTMHRMRLAATKDVDVTVGATPVKAQLRLDVKARCLSCNVDTSVSLMTTKDLCALCVQYGPAEARAIQRKHATPSNKSHMVECTTCQCLYAIVQPELLNIAPKCFYCRQWVKPRPVAPTVGCSRCLNKYLDPAHLMEKLAPATGDNEWICSPCLAEAPQATTVVKTVSFKALVEANVALSRAFGWTKPKRTQDFVALVFNQHVNYFKMYTQHRPLLFGVGAKAQANHGHDTPQDIVLQVDGKPVHGAAALCAALVVDVLEGSLRDVCNLCFDEFSLPQLDSACGRCPTRVCQTCIGRWYGETKIGRVLLTSHLTCPFCRQAPKPSVWQRWNKPAGALVTTLSLPEMKASVYYGWCTLCSRVKEMIAKSCAGDVPRLARFECHDCIAMHAEYYPTCPSCHVQTDKIDGCDHITCVCGQHWCYACGSGFDSAQTTYDHISFCDTWARRRR